MVLEESMAGAGEEEEEEEAVYESDPEEASLSLAMRRREASDDEEGDVEPSRMDPRIGIGSDGESDGQGGAATYDEVESEIEEDEVEEEEEEEVEEVEEVQFEERGSEGGDNDGVEVQIPVVAPESVEDGQRSSGELVEFEDKIQMEGEKKENEPFAVPTAGAFYMHDDRFRDNGSGRHRHMPGGRKLWESKDDRKWGHDKFEEMNLQETQYEKERRKSKGRYRGRSKNQSMDRSHEKGTRPRAYDDRGNQNHTFKTVRGRGPRRYEPPAKSNRETLPAQTKQFGKLPETTSNSSIGRVSTQTRASNVQSDLTPARKHFASSLNSASPPFYPSGSSTQDISVAKERDLPVGSTNKNVSPAVIGEKFSTSQSSALLRGKTVVDSVGQDRLYIDEPVRPVVGKLTNLHLLSSGSSPNNMIQSPKSKPRGRGLAMSGQLNYQPAPSNNQVSKVSQQIQLPAIHHRPVQSPVQPSLRASTPQHLSQHPSSGSGSQPSSPPKFLPASSSETVEVESPPESNKSKNALVAKGKGTVQGSGRGSFLYSGAQVMGVAHGDQKFPGTPALLPVMQFGGQHPGGLGVPAVGMALPGYVAQPQLGFGNSEMTWVPVLAGAAGALGGTYCPPYLAVDGGYYARPSEQTSSSSISSKETSTNKPNNAWKPPQRPELVNDEFGQRQNKPRRYSEMNFGQ